MSKEDGAPIYEGAITGLDAPVVVSAIGLHASGGLKFEVSLESGVIKKSLSASQLQEMWSEQERWSQTPEQLAKRGITVDLNNHALFEPFYSSEVCTSNKC